MPNIQELKDAFSRAHRAGDEENARLLANAIKRQLSSQEPAIETPKKPEPPSGMGAAFRSGLSNLEADRQAILSSFGVEGAEAKAAAARKRAGEQYKQPEFLDQPLNYIGGLAAQSAPYMVAPIVAGGIAASAPVSGALGIGAGVAGLLGAGAASAGQFTGSNLSRQLEGGTAAKDLDVTSAVVAAIPQAALDTVSLRMIPGLRGILGKAGVEITEQQAAKIARDGIIGTTANAVKAYGPSVLKTAGTEGLTESAQQVLERAQAGLSITDPQARQEYYDSFIGGAVLGGTFAVPGRALERGAARDKFEKEAQLKQEAEAKTAADAEAARRQTPEYLVDELDSTFNQLQEQKAALLEQRKELTGGKKKLPKDATPEQRQAFEDLSGQLKETERLLYKIGPEYNKNKSAIAAAKQQRKIEEMSPQDRFLYGDEGAPVETPAAEEAPRTLLDLPEGQEAAAPEPTIESTEGAQQRAGLMLDQLNAWRTTNEGFFEPHEAESSAVRTLMQNPTLAQRMVAEQIPVPGFDSRSSKRILTMLKGQVKAAPEAELTAEQEALQRMGERTRTEQKVESEKEALQRIAGNEQNPPEVTRLLNEIIGKLKEKETKQVVPSDVPLGEGAVERTGIAANEEGVQKLNDMIERYRLMSRQKGAARNDAEMADLLEEIRIAAQPRAENVIGEGEDVAQGKYTAELNRVAKEQEAAFRPAVEAIYELNEYRKTQKPGTIINPKRVAAEKAARDRFVNAVLQEIEANRRAASKPSVTEEEAATIAGRINNILTEAGTRALGQKTVGQEIETLQNQLSELRKGKSKRSGIYASLDGQAVYDVKEKIVKQLKQLEGRDVNERIGSAERAQEVLREQIDEIRREASVAGERKFQKAPEEFRLTPQYAAVEENKVPTELGERRTAVAGRMEDILADEKIALDEKSRSVLADATRMVRDGSGSQGLVEMLEEAARRYETGANIDRTETQRPLFSPDVSVPAGQKLVTSARPEQKIITDTKETQNADLVPAIEKELQLVRKAVAEDVNQGDLFAEDKSMSTGTIRTTAARFQAYLQSAEVARLKAKAQIKEVAAEDKKQTVDVERSLGLIDAHIAQMQKRMDGLVSAVQAARKTAVKQGKRSAGYERVQKGLINRALNLATEASKIDDRYAAVKQFIAQQASTVDSFNKILKDLETQKTKAEQKLAEAQDKKAGGATIEKLKKVSKGATEDVDAFVNAFIAETKNLQSLINGLYAKIDRIKAIDIDSLVSQDASYLREYTDANKNVSATLANAENFRDVLTKIQEDRAKFISQIAGAKRAAEAITRAPSTEKESIKKSLEKSQKNAERQTGLGLTGTKVVKTDNANAIENAKEKLDEAEVELERLTEARKDAKGKEAGALTKKINSQKKEIDELNADIKALEKRPTKIAKPILTGEREIQKPLPQNRAAKAEEKFKGTFDEFKLSGPRAEGELPYIASKVTKRKITAAEHNKLLKAFEEGLSSERGGGGSAPANRLEVIRQASERAQSKRNGTVFRIGGESGITPVDKAAAQKYMVQVKDSLPKNIKFNYSYDLNGAPQEFLDTLIADGIDINNPTELIKGGVMPDGTVVIIGNQHSNLADLELTVAHELVGHYGIDTFLGERGMIALLKAVEARADGIDGLAKELGPTVVQKLDETRMMYDKRIMDAQAQGRPQSDIDKLERAKRMNTLREVIAAAAELPQKPKADAAKGIKKFIQQLVAAFRNAMMRMGFSKLVKADTNTIYELLRISGKSLESKKIGAYRNPQGDIVFSRTAKPGALMSADIAAAVDKIVAGPQTVADRIKAEATGIGARTMFIDRLAPMERVAEHLKKSAQAMQMLYYGRLHDQRMSLTAEAVNNGAPMLEQDEKGNYVIKSRGGANLVDISKAFADVKGYGNAEEVRNLFTAWLAAKRAKNMGVGKAKLNFSENVTQEELDRVEALGDQIPAFEKARDTYNKYNAGLMDWLKQSGAIDEKTYKLLTSMEDYIPYYRARGDSVIMEIAGIQPFTIGNLQQQPYLKELVGGDEKIQDFFTSSLQNTSMLVDMGLRNLATKEIAFSLQSAGLLKGKENKYGEMRHMFPGPGPAQPNVIRFKRGGKDYHAVVESEALGIPSELLVKGLHGTPTVLGGVTKLMAIPARFLRAMVTRSPVYMLRQLLRDSTSNFMLAGGNMVPVLGAATELGKMYAGKSTGEKALQERGIIGGQILSGTSEDMQKIMLQLSKGGSGWEMALAKLDRMSMASDAASRISLYNSYRNGQGLSDMEATLATLESMNFSKRGASGSLYAMNMMIPFLNAQIQGLDVLYKAFTGKMPYSEKLNVQRKLYTRGLLMAGMTVMYAAMMQDDDAYKNADMRDRLANWFIRIPGFSEPVKIPIPFEIGLIFKALPEAALLMNDKDRDVKEVLKGLGQLAATSVPFGPSSVPQAVKPIIEASVNKSFFTGQDIETEAEQGLMPGERVRAKTSGVAKFLGETIGVSPVMVDHFINGYTGGLGLAIAQAAGTMLPLKPGPEAPDKRLSEMPIVGSMFQPNDAQGQISLFYEKAKKYEQAKNTFDKMVDEGRGEEAAEFANKYATDVAMADVAGSFKDTMGEFTEMEKLIKSSDLTGAEKLQRLKEIRATKIEFARSFNAASRQQ
jgi:hypothetical protein